VRHADLRRLLLMRVAPALFGALLGLAATSPEAVIELKNWVAWLGARIVTTAFPDLVS
jgi:hypothetical protein